MDRWRGTALIGAAIDTESLFSISGPSTPHCQWLLWPRGNGQPGQAFAQEIQRNSIMRCRRCECAWIR